MRFGAKIFGTVMVIIFLIVLVSAFITNSFIVDSFFQNNEAIVLIQTELLARQVNNTIDKKQNLLILLGSFALTDYILALQGEDEKEIDEKIKEAEQIFQLFARQEKSEYFTELKFVDPKGNVLIKILNGRIVDEKREDVSREGYFSFLMKTWYKIDKETLDRLKDKVGQEKLSSLDEIANKKVSEEELIDNLKEMDFSEEEIELIEKEAFITAGKEKKYKYISSVFETEQGPAINLACLVEGFNGENIGIIMATYNMGDIHDIFNDVKFKRDWFAEDSFAWLATIDDSEVKLISFPQKVKYDKLMMDLLEEDGKHFLKYSKLSAGKYLCEKYFLENGESRIIAFNPVSDTLDWTVAISIPYRTFFSSAEELQSKLVAVVVIALLLLIIFIFITFLYFLKPLNSLASNLSSVLEEPDRPLEISSNDELGDIGEIFNILREKSLKFHDREEEDRSSLTGLPGNISVQKKLFDIIDSGDKFAVAMVDIDNFNVFNQRYGFVRGDSVIRMTSTLVINMVKEYGNKDDFIGHLGGDDIVFITNPEKVDKICSEIISIFDRQILLYYNEEDREKGGFTWKDKTGAITRYPVTTLSIAVSTNEKRQIIHPLQISQIFSELLVYLKKQPGSMYFKDRRTHERKDEDKETKPLQREDSPSDEEKEKAEEEKIVSEEILKEDMKKIEDDNN